MPANAGQPPLPPWGNALAGATGAVLANAIVYPLDMWVNLLSFYFFRWSKIIMRSFTNCSCTYRVKTRLQVQVKRKAIDPAPLTINEVHYTSALDAVRKIAEDEGILGLYSGIQGSLLGVASTNFAYFYWYSVVRTLYISSRSVPKPPSIAIELSLGALAGAIAQGFTIPVSVVTTRQQTQPKGGKKGLVDTGREVVNSDDGYSGLWRGLKASLVLVVNPAITYGAYQRLRELFFSGKSHLKPWESFCKLSSAITLRKALLKTSSSGSYLKSVSYYSYPATHCC